MDSKPTVGDFDYTIIDPKGIKGMKDGMEYPITEDEWQKAHPEHKDTGCTECTFVQDQETLFTFFVARELKEKVGKRPVFVGKFTMPKWVGHSGFYVFRCKECNEVSVDYPHGYTNWELCYLWCQRHGCGLQLVLRPGADKDRSVYIREKIALPPTLKEHAKNIAGALCDIEEVEDKHGIVVLNNVRIETRLSRFEGIKKFLQDYFN